MISSTSPSNISCKLIIFNYTLLMEEIYGNVILPFFMPLNKIVVLTLPGFVKLWQGTT
jgi:hypothetical protein